MVEYTDNHELAQPTVGEDDDVWGSHLNEEAIGRIEEKLVVRDTEANRSNYTPYADTVFIATDTGAVYDGNGTGWEQATREVAALNSTTYVSPDEGGAGIADAVADGAHIRLEPDAVYDVTAPIGLADAVTIESPTSTTLRATGDHTVISHDGASSEGDILLRNLTLDGDQANTGHDSNLLYFEDVAGITLENVVAMDTWGAGIGLTRTTNVTMRGGGAREIGEPGTANGAGISTNGCSGRYFGVEVRDAVFGFNFQNQRSTVQGESQLRTVAIGCDALYCNRGSIGTGFRAAGSGSSTPSRGYSFLGCSEIESEQYGYMLWDNVHDSQVIGCTSIAPGTHGFYDHGEPDGKNEGNKWFGNTALAPQNSGFRTHDSIDSVWRNGTVLPEHHAYTHTANAGIYAGPRIDTAAVEDTTFRLPAAFSQRVIGGPDRGSLHVDNCIGVGAHGRWGELTATVFDESPSGTGTITYYLDGAVTLDQQGNDSQTADTRIYNSDLVFDPGAPTVVRFDVTNCSFTNTSASKLLVEITDNPSSKEDVGSNYLTGKVQGSGAVRAKNSSGGTSSETVDTSQDNTFANALTSVELRWDGSELTVRVSDGNTTISVTESNNYPSTDLFMKINARDSSGSSAIPTAFDVTDVRILSGSAL